MHDPPLVLNARAAQRGTVTGVERWATEVIPKLAAREPSRYLTLAPPAGLAGRLGQPWEQLLLPARAARIGAALIFSPANLAPLLWPRNVVVLHDAAVLRNSSGYSRPYREWHTRVGLACARRALAVVTVSEFSRRELVTLAGLEPDRLVVIGGGVDARFRPDADDQRVAHAHGLAQPYVLTVGTADRRKNLASLAQAARRLDALGIQLVWAGGTRGHIGQTEPLGFLRPLGYVPEHDLPGLYAGARAFVLPSLYEGFGLPCLEAQACGTPVVASDRAALPETCGGAALLVDPQDPAEIAEAVVRAATDEVLRSALREKGLRRAAVSTWDRTASQVDALLTGVARSL